MKTLRLLFPTITKAIVPVVILICALGCAKVKSEPVTEKPKTENTKEQSIMLALLLDTSNSMDGLIDQAKSQLWKIVNELAAAKCGDGSRPSIKIALYEYGNDGLQSSEGYIRLVSPLTNDLDEISRKLFSLTTNGGNEFCGAVINRSLSQLEWSSSEADLKMIFIAGNEPFDQGEVPYAAACSLASRKGVIVNTIFCGGFDEGIQTDWKKGADLAHGTYMSIEQNRKTVFIATPFDDSISKLNDRLNDTYIYYGHTGNEKKENQRIQDENAASYGAANKVDRTISKSSHAYKNSTWDLVDAAKDDAAILEKADKESLPKEMQTMTVDQRKAYVKQKTAERDVIQKEIQVLNTKRQAYINAHTTQAEKDTMLDGAMLRAIREKALTKKMSF